MEEIIGTITSDSDLSVDISSVDSVVGSVTTKKNIKVKLESNSKINADVTTHNNIFGVVSVAGKGKELINYFITPEQFGAKGDGITDDTESLKMAIEYASNNRIVLYCFPYKTYLVDHIEITDIDGLTIRCESVIKRRANASTNAILHFDRCANVSIEKLNTDGNVWNNVITGQTVNQYKASLSIENSNNFIIGEVTDYNPCGDSIYINNVDFLFCDYLRSRADVNCGRNSLSIIKGTNITFNFVDCENVGSMDMPGGICIEPNYDTDTLININIKNANIITGGTSGFQVANIVANARGENISILDCNIIKTVDNGTCVSIGNVNNFYGKFNVINESMITRPLLISQCKNSKVEFFGKNFSRPAYIYEDCENLTLNGVLENVNDYGINCQTKNGKNIKVNLTLKNILLNPIIFENTSENVEFCLEIQRGDLSSRSGAIYLPSNSVVSNLIFRNCDFTGYPIIGIYSDMTALKFFDCFGYNYLPSKPTSNNFYPKGAIVYNTNPSVGDYVGWVCVEGGYYNIEQRFKGFGMIE